MFARCKPSLNELKIEQISQLYFKHKVFGLKQFRMNVFSSKVLDYLYIYYKCCSPPKESFIAQFYDVEKAVGEPFLCYTKSIELLDSQFQNNYIELRRGDKKANPFK